VVIGSNGVTGGCLAGIEQIPQMLHGSCAGHPELLIEIAVKQPSRPIDADQASAHHCIEIAGVVGLLQALLVALQFAAQFELACKALDRHVRQGEQMVEVKSQLTKLPFVVGLQGGLCWWQ